MTVGDEDDLRPGEERAEFSEEADSLWRITFGPLIWAVHFALSYAATAVFCAKIGAENESIAGFRIAIGALAVVALAGILWLGWRSWRQWDVIADRRDDPQDYNQWGTGEDRHQFLGHAAFLLAIISFVGVVYVAMPILFIGTCR